MNERDAGQGGAFGKHLRGEAGAVIHVKPFGYSIGEECLLEDNREDADRFGSAEGMSDDHAGVIVDNGAKDGLVGAVLELHLGAVEEVAYPEVVDIVQLIGFARYRCVFSPQAIPGF